MRGVPLKIEPEVVVEMVKSQTIKQIAVKLKCTANAVYKFCYRHKIRAPNRSGRPRIKFDLLKMKFMALTMSFGNMAKDLGCSKTCVRRYVIDNRIPKMDMRNNETYRR